MSRLQASKRARSELTKFNESRRASSAGRLDEPTPCQRPVRASVKYYGAVDASFPSNHMAENNANDGSHLPIKPLYQRELPEPREITPHTNEKKKDTARSSHTRSHATINLRSTRRLTFDLHLYSTHGQRASYRATIMSVNGGLGGIIGIGGLGGERVGRGVRRSSSKHYKNSASCQRREIECFCGLCSAHQLPNTPKYVFSRRLIHPRHISPTEV